MPVRLAVKLAFVGALALLLAGCVDAKLDVAVQSPTTAEADLSLVMSAEFYAMIKPPPLKTDGKGQTELGPEVNHFCADGVLAEKADGTATCTLHTKGSFDRLALGRHPRLLRFTKFGPGLVRVALRTAGLAAELDAKYGNSPEAEQMTEALFSGHQLAIRFSGLEVIDTNMSLSADKTSAGQAIQFLDVIHGTANLPAELYAVVRVK